MSGQVWLLLIAAQCAWAGSYVAMKFAGEELAVGVVVVLRYLIAVAGFTLIGRLPRFHRDDWLLILTLGTLNFALSPSLQVASLRYTQAADASILIALEPLVTVAAAGIVLRNPLGSRTIWASIAGLAGALVLSGVGAPTGDLTQERLLGNALFLTSMCFEVSVTVAGGRLTRRYDPLAAMAALKACGLLASAVIYAPVLAETDFGAISSRAWLSVGYLGIFASVVGYGIWYHAIRHAPVSQVAMSLYLQPIVGAALGVWLAGETIGLHTLFGAAIIAASLLWWRMGLRSDTKPEPAPSRSRL